MDIKDLNKPQLILLAILLSFVTSIATGIVTVTLMQQAPDSVTVPINRVIQQTVEKIQQVEGKTTVNTVVIKEEDLVVDAIEKNKSAVFSITKDSRGEDGEVTQVSAGRGFAVSSTGIIVADSVLTGSEGVYFVKNSSGTFTADFISADSAGFSFLRIGAPVDLKDKLAFTLPSVGDTNKMKAGQKVIVLGSVISSFIFDGQKNITVPLNKSSAGGMVVNLDGEALGIALYNEVTSFASITAVNESLKNINP
ncbi:MAG TPA: hypothetical protein VJC14_00760 [Candidatus Paceibacterota bacterium]